MCSCQTTVISYFYYPNMRICSASGNRTIDEIDVQCLMEKWQIYSDDSNILKICDCPIECETTSYDYAISFSEYPTYFHAKLLTNSNAVVKSKFDYKSNNFHDELRRSIAKISIYYKELKQIESKENIKTQTFDLISNIGGIMGLFLGQYFYYFLTLNIVY